MVIRISYCSLTYSFDMVSSVKLLQSSNDLHVPTSLVIALVPRFDAPSVASWSYLIAGEGILRTKTH